MTRATAKPFVLALTLALSSGSAFAASGDSVPQATRDALREKLQAGGYEVRSIQMEDGLIEVYALKDGARLEVCFDDALNIVRTEIDG